MQDFLFLMHNDAETREESTYPAAWSRYIESLSAKEVFRGGSSIGSGICKNSSGAHKAITHHFVGYIRIQEENLS